MIWVFLLALLVRVVWGLAFDPHHIYWPDEKVYDETALGLATGQGFRASSYYSTPLWPMFLAVCYKLFGHSYVVVRLIQSLLGAAVCVLAASLAGRMFNRRVGLWAGLALALYPPLIYLAGVLYIENFYSFWLMLSTYLLVRLYHAPGVLGSVLTGVCLGLTALSRTVAFALVPVAGLVPLLAASLAWRRRLVLALVMWMSAAAVIAPWTARNWFAYDGHLVLLSTGGGLTLWRGNCPFSRGTAGDRYLGVADDYWRQVDDSPEAHAYIKGLRARIAGLDDAAADRVLGQEARRYMREHPLRCALLYGKKLLTLHAAFSPVVQSIQHISPRRLFVNATAYYPVLLLGVGGLLLHARRWRELLPLYLVWGLFAFSLPLLTTCTRFRLPTEPILIVFASAAAVALWERLAETRTVARWLGAVIVVGVALRLAWCGFLPNDFVWQDEREYDAIACNLLDRGAYSMDGTHPTAFRAPGQTLFLAAAYSLDRGLAGVRVWQSLLWGVAIWLSFRVAREMGASERASLWTAAAVAVYPVYVYAAGTLFPMTLFTVALLAGTLGLLRIYNGAGRSAVILAGTGMGVGTLTIPYLLPAALLAALWLGRRRWREALGVVALALVIVAPWPLRNWAVLGEPVMGTQQWLCFWYGNNPQATGFSGSKIRLEPAETVWAPYDAAFRTNEVAGERFLRDDALRYVREHPGHTAWLWARKAANLFRLWPETQTQNIYTTWVAKLAGALSFGPVLLLGLLGWWRGGLDRRRAAIIAIYFAVFTAVAAVTLSKDRYRMPLDVYLMIPAAMLVERWLLARRAGQG
ncbi:MAG: glycosyltransferase family 39 protein [Verrucomicrobia bacterium]|nr:glycosyltransferase family 39 protein [Verrucomicrobiota bacterium]